MFRINLFFHFLSAHAIFLTSIWTWLWYVDLQMSKTRKLLFRCGWVCMCVYVHAHANEFMFYKLLTKVINKDCCHQHATMKVMMIVMMMTDLMIRQQLSLMMMMMTVMLPLYMCVCTWLIFFIPRLDSRAKRCVANLCKNVRCVRVCVWQRERWLHPPLQHREPTFLKCV